MTKGAQKIKRADKRVERDYRKDAITITKSCKS
jgi:hypothetical protein